MKITPLSLSLVLLLASAALGAQSTPSASDLSVPAAREQSPASARTPAAKRAQKADAAPKPFSRLALSGGVGTMGINMQAAVNANRYINLRGTGNYLTYTVSYTHLTLPTIYSV